MPSDPDPAFEELLAIGRKLLLQKYKPGPYTPLDTNGAIGNYNVRFQKADSAAEELIGLGVHCSVCFSVSRDLAVFSRRRNQGQDRDPRAFIQWRFRLDALANAAMDGCHFCGFMANRFFDDPGYTFFSGPSMSTQWVRCCGYSSKTEVSESLIKSVANIRKFLEEHSDADFTLVAQPTDYRLYDLEYGKIHFWAIGTSLTPDAVKRILGCRQRIVLEIYALETRNWIKECIEMHTMCSYTTSATLPKRVIEILGNESLTLREDAGFGSYATLSYCWGGPQKFCTTVNTLEERKGGFNVSELPKTLQDAVRVTEEIGLRFLWVDSICILQDSGVDKEREIPKMASYYKNSYVTIAAASAKSCYDGFLQQKEDKECPHHRGFGLAKDLLKLPFVTPDAEIGTVLFREETPYCLSWEPIAKRAWTLQEKLLSPRVLLYADRLVWQCHSAQQGFGGFQDWSYDFDVVYHWKLELRLAADGMRSEAERQNYEDGKGIYGFWYGAVGEFSWREVTFPEDKLPAIGGLAAEVAAMTGDEYVAGLWKRTLLRELLWSTYPHLPLLRSPSWRSPSWSWASLDNPVTFERLPPLDAVELASITRCSTTPKSVDFLFGQFMDAELEICGPVMEADAETISKLLENEYRMQRPDDSVNYRRVMMHASSRSFLSTRLSAAKGFEVPINSVLLFLFAHPVSKEDHQDQDGPAVLSGLVLEPKSDGRYGRVHSFSQLSSVSWKSLREPSGKRSMRIV